MTKLILFTELLEIGNELLEAGMKSSNIYEARKKLDDIFEKFEENSDYPTYDLSIALNEIAINALSVPKGLKDYFHAIESFQAENEIYLHELPQLHTMEHAQLMAGFYTILENLLGTSITPCDAHQAHVQLYELSKCFEELTEELEEMAEDDFTLSVVSQFFPDLQEQLDGLTLFPA